MRKIMQDKSSAGAVAMLTLLLFLLQGLATGVAHGSMAGMALGTDGIICSSHTPDGASSKQEQDPATKLANDCCGTLCRLAFAASVALVVSPTEIASVLTAKANVVFFRHDATSPPPPTNRESQPRGPPLTSQR